MQAFLKSILENLYPSPVIPAFTGPEIAAESVRTINNLVNYNTQMYEEYQQLVEDGLIEKNPYEHTIRKNKQ